MARQGTTRPARTLYIEAVSLTDDQLDGIRRAPAYRGAVWVTRLIALPWLGSVVTAFSGTARSGHLSLVFWLLTLALVLLDMALLRRASSPLGRRRGSTGPRLLRGFRDDVLGRRRR